MEIKSKEIINNLTILIPTYNEKEEKLRRTLENILGRYNIIISDDGSKDEYINILKKIEQEYLNEKENKKKTNAEKIDFKIIYNKKNGGLAENRNILVSNVKTEFFTFLDAGDIFNINLLEKGLENILNFLKKEDLKDIDIIKFNLKNINETELNNYSFEEKKLKDKNTNENKYFKIYNKGIKCFIDLVKNKKAFDTACGKIYRTSFFKENDFKYLKGHVHEDFGITPYIIICAKKVLDINLNIYLYIQDDGSITRGLSEEKKFKNANSAFVNAKRQLNLVEKIYNDGIINKNELKYFYSFLTNALVNNISNLNGEYKKEYIKLLNSINIEKGYLNNIKGIIKKIIYILKYKNIK